MAKTTKAGGDSYTPDELSDPDAPIRIRRAELGKVDQKSADGTGFSPSSKAERKLDESAKANPPEPVHTTESHSKAPEAVPASDANSAVGPTRKTPAKQSVKHNPKKATVRSTDDDPFDDAADDFNI